MRWYKYSIRDLTNDEYVKWYSLMEFDKKQRVDRFRFADDKKRTVASEMLARKAISEWCDIVPERINFGIRKYGKPYAKGVDVEFNISHSGDMVVCAIDDKNIGIDIEQIHPINLMVAKRICTDKELLYLFGHNPEKNDFTYTKDNEILTRFYKLWTAREAYGKYIGVGLFANYSNINSDAVRKYDIQFDEYIGTIYSESD